MTGHPRIDSLLPFVATDLGDDVILDGFAPDDRGRRLSINFVSSLDGAATHNGLSGGLGDDADRRVFDLLRRPCDAVLLGAGTVRVERYGAMRLDAASVDWRTAAGLAPHPVFAIVSRSLDLDPGSAVFADAPVRPVVATVDAAPKDRRAALSRVADVLICGETRVEPTAMLDAFAARGLTRVHSEGGPTLFGSLLAEDVVDELFLTISPLLEGGDARRIATGILPARRGMRLAGVLVSGDTLLLRYERDRN